MSLVNKPIKQDTNEPVDLHLFIWELPGIFLYVSLIQVSGHVHQTDFREAEVGQFDVSHWGHQQTVGTEGQIENINC